MLGKIVEKWGRARFYLSRNYSGSLYSLKKKLFFKLKNLHSSACFDLNYDAAKQYPKLVGFIKSCDQYPHKFNFVHF